MKRIWVALLLIGLSSACQKKTVPVNNVNSSGSSKLLFEQTPEPYIVISIKRTSCFGKCPAYEASIYSDGKVTYHGISNVEMRGIFVSSINTADINKILVKAFEIKYFDMADQYPVNGEKIADLPSAITSISCTGHKKKITNKYQGPESLKTFEEMIDLEIYKLKYKTTDAQK
ncbi:MAG TPA: DUF6438 domain-containing protein [Saprospiraceae bacterium]|nr:DUF6438 domain-containing protein [Saprospiraceae bacterium]